MGPNNKVSFEIGGVLLKEKPKLVALAFRLREKLIKSGAHLSLGLILEIRALKKSPYNGG